MKINVCQKYYQIEGPALISFSGGRSSGYMLYQILKAHDFKLPENVIVSFQNTGKEMPETLEFINQCSVEWGVGIVWLEYRPLIKGHTFEIVNFETASRNGEPFEAIIDKKSYLPNPVTRFCTYELKVKTAERFCRSLGWDYWDMVVGLRGDEQRRAVKMLNRHQDRWETLLPMYSDGVTKHDVSDFWKAQSFDLNLPNFNGVTLHGNCDLCFLKGTKQVMSIIKENPDLADWWAKQETKPFNTIGNGDRFRSDRPSYEAMKLIARDQFDLFSDDTQACFCTD